MTWSLFWKMLLAFIVIIYADDMSNRRWNQKKMGSFVFWIFLMLIGVVDMMILM